MTLLSVSAFAKTHGVSKAAAQKWQAKGHLVMREGKVVVEPSDANLKFADLGRFSKGPVGSRQQPATGNQVADQVAAPPEVARTDDGEIDFTSPDTINTLTEFVERLMTGRLVDAATAELVRVNALALTRTLNAKREAGRLIDLETAEAVLFEAAREAREAWMKFPASAGPLIAVELGIDSDKLVEALSAHVHQQLADIGEPEADFSERAPSEDGVSSGADTAAED